MAQIGFFGMLQKVYSAVGNAADAAGNLAEAANNVSMVAKIKSETYLEQVKLEDQASLTELRLKLEAKAQAQAANPALLLVEEATEAKAA